VALRCGASRAICPRTSSRGGTFLDSLRFRFHLGQRLGVDPRSVEAQVIGEHGTSQVFLWSTARVAGTTFAQSDAFRREVEHDVRYANISIIEGTGASQLGIGVVAARIAETVGRDERAVVPIGSYQETYGVTLSLPSRLGRGGVVEVLMPALAEDEARALDESAATLRRALQSIESRSAPRRADLVTLRHEPPALSWRVAGGWMRSQHER
jgi:L-lactate dehydrogenase